MNKIDYDHSQNLHLMDAPSRIFPIINTKYNPKSVLDIGCGKGTWLKVVSECGIEDFLGVDGVEVINDNFLVSKESFFYQDLREQWDLNKKFDLAICLEVAEHLPEESAVNFIYSLILHSNTIIFSAACPHQGGQGHINCQWPSYWQEIFNNYGYACFDEIRPIIWNYDFPEYWYKQNIFVAKKDEKIAGTEERILPLVHPVLYESYCQSYIRQLDINRKMIDGEISPKTYIKMFIKSLKVLIS